MPTDFAARLLTWYGRHGRRDLPWKSSDPYRVWVSEIMLQQTQVQTVIPYYERFIARFPDVVTLADAPADDVLQHWSGLGYYARARNLHQAARVIRDEHGGTFPCAFDTVVALPGIGRSTAGAILALAFGERHPILDGNAKRVYARHAAIGGWPGKAGVAAKLWALADAYTPTGRAADYTQAIMDLGATLCTRTKPECSLCPVRKDCAAREAQAIADYPGRRPKKDKPLRATTMLLAVCDDALYLERRPPCGIWGGLWSLPELGGDTPTAWCARVTGTDADVLEEWRPVRHSFTHFDLDIRPVLARVRRCDAAIADRDDALWYCLDDTPPGGIAAPVSTLIERLRTTGNGSHR